MDTAVMSQDVSPESNSRSATHQLKSYTVNVFNVCRGSKVLVRLASLQLDLLLEKT